MIGAMPQPEITVAAIAETEGRFLVVEERINSASFSISLPDTLSTASHC